VHEYTRVFVGVVLYARIDLGHLAACEMTYLRTNQSKL